VRNVVIVTVVRSKVGDAPQRAANPAPAPSRRPGWRIVRNERSEGKRKEEIDHRDDVIGEIRSVPARREWDSEGTNHKGTKFTKKRETTKNKKDPDNVNLLIYVII
jgi:hypothetical protein